jgi:hypothetical protein
VVGQFLLCARFVPNNLVIKPRHLRDQPPIDFRHQLIAGLLIVRCECEKRASVCTWPVAMGTRGWSAWVGASAFEAYSPAAFSSGKHEFHRGLVRRASRREKEKDPDRRRSICLPSSGSTRLSSEHGSHLWSWLLDVTIIYNVRMGHVADHVYFYMSV